MRESAAAAGIDLLPLSSFRDFERQRLIWNAKYRGERPALDRGGRTVDMSRLAPDRRIETILLWSALPGASRHHWGSDIDVADGRVIAGGYEARARTRGVRPRRKIRGAVTPGSQLTCAATVSTGPTLAQAAECNRNPGT